MKALILHSFDFNNVLSVHINFEIEITQELTDTTRMYNRYRHILFSGFGTSLGKVRIIILSAALECAKKVHFGPWPKKVVHPCVRGISPPATIPTIQCNSDDSAINRNLRIYKALLKS